MIAIELSQNVAAAPLPQLAMRPSPALIAATSLLAMASVEIERAIDQELVNTPALERVDGAACGLCGGPMAAGRCQLCDRPRRISQGTAGGTCQVSGEAAAEPSRAETLLAQVAPLVAASERAIVAYVIESLDPRGFLGTTVEQIASALAVEDRTVARILSVVQASAPAGVGARDLRECLLLQLDRRHELEPAGELARRIVADHLELLGRGKYGQAARNLGVERAEVVAALAFIREHLQPYPALEDPGALASPPLVPDIAIRESGAGVSVELLERDRLQLAVSPAYERALSAPLTPDEREAIRRQLRAAREFIDRLEQRWRTIAAVAEVVAERQREFVRRGARYLVPLTRAEVACELGVHESTVSRAVAGRNVLLPSGRVVAMARFFGRSGAPEDALAELIATEVRPKSDAELAEDLAALGFALARRTVTKYRERLGILPSSLRRTAKPASQLRIV